MAARKKISHAKLLEDPATFGATVLRMAFAILFLLVAMKKFRMGIGNFADSIASTDSLISQDIAPVVLYMFGFALPILELLVGVLLLIDRDVKSAYGLAAIIYLALIFGQVYNGNTPRVGMEYFPSLLALIAAYHLEDKKKS